MSMFNVFTVIVKFVVTEVEVHRYRSTLFLSRKKIHSKLKQLGRFRMFVVSYVIFCVKIFLIRLVCGIKRTKKLSVFFTCL